MPLEIPRYHPYSEDSRTLISEAHNLAHALNNNQDAVVPIYTCSGPALLPRAVVFLKAVDNFLALKDLGYEDYARTQLYDRLINPKEKNDRGSEAA